VQNYKDHEEETKDRIKQGFESLSYNIDFTPTPKGNPAFDLIMREFNCHNTNTTSGGNAYLNGWELMFKMANKILRLEEEFKELQGHQSRKEIE